MLVYKDKMQVTSSKYRKKATKDLEKEREGNRSQLVSHRAPLYVVADNIRSLDNVGLLFRLCELTRVRKLYLCGITGYPKVEKNERRAEWKAERADQRIKKTAIYAVPFVPWQHSRSALSIVKKLKSEGVQIVVLEQVFGSTVYNQIDYRLPLALVVGHEIKGVSQKIINEADFITEIPTFGIGNSLNVAIATGITLYKIIEKTAVFGKM